MTKKISDQLKFRLQRGLSQKRIYTEVERALKKAKNNWESNDEGWMDAWSKNYEGMMMELMHTGRGETTSRGFRVGLAVVTVLFQPPFFTL